MNYLERKAWRESLLSAEAHSDLDPLGMLTALLEHGEVRIERRDDRYVVLLMFGDSHTGQHMADSGRQPSITAALEICCWWARSLLDDMGIIARCSCGSKYNRTEWRKLSNPRPWFVEDGEILILRECACRSTISLRARDAIPEVQP